MRNKVTFISLALSGFLYACSDNGHILGVTTPNVIDTEHHLTCPFIQKTDCPTTTIAGSGTITTVQITSVTSATITF